MAYISFDEYCLKNNIEPNSISAYNLKRRINADYKWKNKNVRFQWSIFGSVDQSKLWRINEYASIHSLQSPGCLIGLILLIITLIIWITVGTILLFVRSIIKLIAAIKEQNVKWIYLSTLGILTSITLGLYLIGGTYIVFIQGQPLPVPFVLIPVSAFALFAATAVGYALYRAILKLRESINDQLTPNIIVYSLIEVICILCIGGIIGATIYFDHYYLDYVQKQRVSAPAEQPPQMPAESPDPTDTPNESLPEIEPTTQPEAAPQPEPPASEPKAEPAPKDKRHSKSKSKHRSKSSPKSRQASVL